ncbi:MAG: hypothetical protein VX967_03960, partial [SAR324 cluster bacterium]|nr:hypothetical protein [SAR324 cluster bacterium]
IFYFMLFLGTAQAQEKEMSAETEAQSEKSSSSEYTWHYAAVSVTLVSALMSYNAAKSYNDLSAKNSTLATQYANSSSSSEQASYKSEYDSNSSKMKSYKRSLQTWDILTLLGLGWEAYLLMSDESGSSVLNSGTFQFPFIPRLAYQTYPYGTKTVLRWNMSF